MIIEPEFQEIIDNWLNWLLSEKQYSKHTYKSYKKDLLSFFKYIAGENIIDVNLLLSIENSDLRSWFNSLKDKKYSNASIARNYSVFKNFINYLYKYENINLLKLQNLKSPKINNSLPRALSSFEVKTIIENIALDETDWLQMRDKAILYLLYGAGLRISEALNLTKSQINNQQLIILGKGKKTRTLPLLPIIEQTITAYLKIMPYPIKYDEPIFRGKKGGVLKDAVFNRVLIKLRRKYNLPEIVSAHAFRHSFATDLLTEGSDLRSIQELLGHENLSTTQRYTKVDIKKLINTHNKFHPLDKD